MIGRNQALLATAAFVISALLAMAPAPSALMGPASGQLFVSPETTVVAELSSLVLGIDVTADVASLMGYNVGVTFDHTLIALQSADEGSLPESSSDTTFFYYWYGPGVTDPDSLHVNGAILGRTVDGPGTLFTMSFDTHEVTQPETTEVWIGYSELRNGVNQPITHTTKGGIVIIEPTVPVEKTTWGALKARYE